MLAIFNSELVQPPKELKSPVLDFQNTPKLSRDILNDFVSSQPTNAFSISFRDKASLAYAPPLKPHSMSHTHRYIFHLSDYSLSFFGGISRSLRYSFLTVFKLKPIIKFSFLSLIFKEEVVNHVACVKLIRPNCQFYVI